MHATRPFPQATSSNREELHSARFSNRCKPLLETALPAGCFGGSHCWCSVAGSAGNRTWNFEYKTWRYILHMSAPRPRTPLQLNINSVRHAGQWKVTCQTHATAVPHNSRQQMPFHCSSKTAAQLRDCVISRHCVTRHARGRDKCVAMCAGM